MKKISILTLVMFIAFIICSCMMNEKKPYGANSFDYDRVEGINKNGPNIDEIHIENQPPTSDKSIFVEKGPIQIDNSDIIIEPTADMDEEPDYLGIPIIIKGNESNGS